MYSFKENINSSPDNREVLDSNFSIHSILPQGSFYVNLQFSEK